MAKVPSAYQEVEWIQSDSNSYIDTGYYATQDTKIEITFMRTSSDSIVFGGETSWNSNAFHLYSSNNAFDIGLGDQKSGGTGSYKAGLKYTMIMDKTSCTITHASVTDVSLTYTTSSFTAPYSAYLFTDKRSSFSYNEGIRIYSCKLYTNSTEVHNFIPCYRISDSEVGMYDLTTNTFFGNGGTGTFSKGKDINYYINKVVFGENTLLDLTNDTLLPSDVAYGKMFHMADGASGIGMNGAKPKDINFYDYDGTIVESWTLAESKNKTALPAMPEHDGLTSDSWNWTLAEIQSWGYPCEVGLQCYASDRQIHIFLNIDDDLHRTITFNDLQAATIDFGDGTTISYGGWYSDVTHTYSSVGRYEITIDGGFSYHTIGSVMSDAITEIWSDGFGGEYQFQLPGSLHKLEKVAVGPNDNGLLLGYRGGYCYSLFYLTVSRAATWSTTNCAMDWTGLRAISFPPTFTYLGGNGLNASNLLQRLCIPGLTSTGGSTVLRNLSRLTKIVLPSSLTSLSPGAFQSTGLYHIRFLATTPATFEDSNVLAGIDSTCRILFPYDSTGYLTATNYPSTTTYKYIGFGTFTSGATLPTLSTDGSYDLTWYANEADAYNDTTASAIATGNGSEVYCRHLAC